MRLRGDPRHSDHIRRGRAPRTSGNPFLESLPGVAQNRDAELRRLDVVRVGAESFFGGEVGEVPDDHHGRGGEIEAVARPPVGGSHHRGRLCTGPREHTVHLVVQHGAVRPRFARKRFRDPDIRSARSRERRFVGRKPEDRRHIGHEARHRHARVRAPPDDAGHLAEIAALRVGGHRQEQQGQDNGPTRCHRHPGGPSGRGRPAESSSGLHWRSASNISTAFGTLSRLIRSALETSFLYNPSHAREPVPRSRTMTRRPPVV